MWKSIIAIKPDASWKFTPEIEGTYFRLRHINPPRSPVGWIGQAELILNTSFHQVFGIQRINGLSVYEILELQKPPIFSSRKLAFRQESKAPNEWLIEVEVSLMPISDLSNQPVVNPVGSSLKIKTTVTVTTTPTKLLPTNLNRKDVTFFNGDNSKDVYIDTDSTISANSAIARIPAKKLYISDIKWQGEYWAVAEQGTINVDIEEYV